MPSIMRVQWMLSALDSTRYRYSFDDSNVLNVREYIVVPPFVVFWLYVHVLPLSAKSGLVTWFVVRLAKPYCFEWVSYV